jgi:hypothetical protein
MIPDCCKYLFSNWKVKRKLIKNIIIHGFTPLSGITVFTLRPKKIVNVESPKTIVCKNCGKEFIGSYCPICGQEAKTSRLNFSSFTDSLFSGLTNISRGFGFTMINLFSRPGYMLNDFIKGKRIFFTKPFQMLFVLAAVYAVLSQLFALGNEQQEKESVKNGVENIAETAKSNKENLAAARTLVTVIKTSDSTTKAKIIKSVIKIGEKDTLGIKNPIVAEVLKNVDKTDSTLIAEKINMAHNNDSNDIIEIIIETFGGSKEKFYDNYPFLSRLLKILSDWYKSNKAIVEITIIPFIALSIKWAFRKSKSNDKLNYIECVFIATYLACQLLIISLFALLLGIPHENNTLLRICMGYWMALQLYHNSWSSTIRKTLMTMLYTFILLILTIIIILVIAGILIYSGKS